MNSLEGALTRIRSWSLRQPNGESVVVLMSGGIDSSVLAELCIKQLSTTLYPLYIRRGAKAEDRELEATKRIVDYLRAKYPTNIYPLKVISCTLTPLELSNAWSHEKIQTRGIPLRNLMLISLAVQYACSLHDSIRTIILGAEKVLPEGGEYPDMSLQSLFANSLAICSNLDQWNWQVMSPLLIAGLVPGKSYLTKKDLVDWANENQFPIDYTYSCTSGNEECLQCRSCKARSEIIKIKEGI